MDGDALVIPPAGQERAAPRRQGSAALRVRSDGAMCVAPHVPLAFPRPSASASPAAAAAAVPRRRKKLKWRTRDSQSSRLYNLQLDVHAVQQQIRALDDHRALLAARVLNRQDALDGRYVRTVMEYHRVFERGYHPPGAASAAAPQLDARQFLRQTMDERLRIGRFSGLDVLLDQWERYTRAQTGLEFRYKDSRVVVAGDSTIVTSRATYSHVVTLDMVESMFPQLLTGHRGVLAKILGSRVHGEGQYEFTFDPRTHRVVHFEFRLDYMEIFARLLRDVRELDALFSRARISEESLIGDIDAYDAYRSDLSRHPSHDLKDLHDRSSQQEPRFVELTHEANADSDEQRRQSPSTVDPWPVLDEATEQLKAKRDPVLVSPPAEYR